MSELQYVGARYVPKFADPYEWQANTIYEPLTVVMYNRNSYTSKKQVPANIGEPTNNPEYWVCTGNYNGQIEEISNAIAKEISDRTNADSALDDKISAEVTARTNADSALDDNISAEVTARTNADSALDDKISAEVTARTEADSALDDKIEQEITARKSLIEQLSGDTVIKSSNDVLIGGKDIALSPSGNLIYGEPTELNDYFKTVPMMSSRGSAYEVLVKNTDTALLGGKRNIILVGDSYAQGIGGISLAIEEVLKVLLPHATIRTMYNGGAGYIRSGNTYQSVLENGSTSITDKDAVTDVVIIGSVYNDAGAINQSDFNEDGFVTAISNLNTYVSTNYPNANLSIVASLWINVTYNITFKMINMYTLTGAVRSGVKYVNALNWLMPYGDSVQSGDNIHPSNDGYLLIAQHISSFICDSDPKDKYEVVQVTSATGDAITFELRGNYITISGDITKQSGQSFNKLCDVPTFMRNLINYPVVLYDYNDQKLSSSVYGIVMSDQIYVASDNLVAGHTYMIRTFVPVRF